MPIDFTGPNKWQRVYFNRFEGNPNNAEIKAGLIDPFEVPLTFDQHVLAVAAFSSEVKPRWRTAGYLTQTYSGIDFNDTSVTATDTSPTSGVDAANKRIGLNTVELVIFPRLASNFFLWFDPVPWLKSLNFSIWEYQGIESPDRLEELIETVKVDIVRVEYKLDMYNS